MELNFGIKLKKKKREEFKHDTCAKFSESAAIKNKGGPTKH